MTTLRALAALSVALAHPALGAEGLLTLDEALALASRQNADLALAREDASTAGADRTRALGALLPRLDLTASFGQSRLGEQSGFKTEEGIDVPAQPSSHNASYSLTASLSQPVFDWPAFQDARRAGAAETAAARLYDESVLSVAFDVTRRFYEVLRAERTLAVLEKTVARTQELVNRADALYAAGKAPRSDTYTNRVNLANDRIAVEQQVARTVAARTALVQSLGRSGVEADGLSVAVPSPLDRADVRPAEPPRLEAVLELARTRRPSLAAAKAVVDAADAAVRSAQGGYLPTVDARVSYSRNSAELGGATGVYGDLRKEYSATLGLVASWNLFEGRQTLAAVQRAESQARRARASQDRTLQAVVKEIADARALVASEATQVTLSADNLATAEKALALARERLEAGLATQLEVREASLNLTRAELSLVEARIDHAVAFADLARASGGPL